MKTLLITILAFIFFSLPAYAVTQCETLSGDRIVNYQASEVDGVNHVQMVFCENELGVSAIYLTLINPEGIVLLYGFCEITTNSKGQEYLELFISSNGSDWISMGYLG